MNDVSKKPRVYHHIPAVLTSILSTLVAAGCGSGALSRLVHHHHSGGSSPVAGVLGNNNASGLTSYQFTANYHPRPVDVIIIRDGASHDNPIDGLLTKAIPVLSARLWDLASTVGSVHVAVYDEFFDRDNPGNDHDSRSPIDPGAPITDAKNPSPSLMAETMSATDFGQSLADRIDAAGGRGGNAQPASVLLAAQAVSSGPSPKVTGIFRNDAFWSVLYISATHNPNDPNAPQDVISKLGGHAAGFEVSTLAIEGTGCMFASENPPESANPDNERQRLLEIKLQQLTGGVFASVCSATYSLFMDDFARHGTGTQYFAQTLPTPVQAASIQITGLNGVEIKDFRYTPGSTVLDVSTHIPSGQAFTVHAIPDSTPSKPVVSTAPGDPAVPQAKPPVGG